MNYKNIKVEKRENYAIIEIANNKNNSLDQKTLNEISDATKNLNQLKEIKCIGLIGGPKFFSPGADIKELEKLRRNLDQQVFSFQPLIVKIANRLQRKLLAQQNRHWDFNMEEGFLDTSRLAKIIADKDLI